jgi:hypothetical protein
MHTYTNDRRQEGLDMKRSNGSTARTTRRTIIGTLLAAPGVAVGARAMAQVRRHATLIRPDAAGTSSTRCASCGADDHTMLSCPSNPVVV